MEAQIWWDEKDLAFKTNTGIMSTSPFYSQWHPDHTISFEAIRHCTVGEIDQALRTASDTATAAKIFSAKEVCLFVDQDLPAESSTFSLRPYYISEESALEPHLSMSFYHPTEHPESDIEVTTEFLAVEPIDTDKLETAIDPLLNVFTSLTIKSISWDPYYVTIKITPEKSTTVQDISDFNLAARAIALTGGLLSDNPFAWYASVATSQGLCLLGQAESQILEAKRDPYDLSSNSGKYSLSVDVASFANSGKGGVIVIGATTRRDELGRDVIHSVNGIPDNSIPNLQQICGILETRIVPSIEGLQVHTVETRRNPLLMIVIPPQDATLLPFLVCGAEFENGLYSGSAFSISTRRRSTNIPMSPTTIHSLIAAGRAALHMSNQGNDK